MANRPFTSEHTDIFNEATYNTVPNTFGLNNVNTTEAHRRSILDSFSQSVAANQQPPSPFGYPCACSYGPPQIQIMQAQKQFIPDGVSFTFNPSAQRSPLPNYSSMLPSVAIPTYPQQLLQPTQVPQHLVNIQNGRPELLQTNYITRPPFAVQNSLQQLFQPNQLNVCSGSQMPEQLTLQQQIALKQLETQSLELMLLQEHLKTNPYKLQFHHNGQTSTTDLLKGLSQIPASQGMPDIENMAGVTADLKSEVRSIGSDQFPWDCPPSCLYTPVSKAKKLVFTKSPEKQKSETSEEISAGAGPCTSFQTNQESQAAQSSKSKLNRIDDVKQASSSKEKEQKKSDKQSKKSRKPSRKPKPRKVCSCTHSSDSGSTSSRCSLRDEEEDEYDEEKED